MKKKKTQIINVNNAKGNIIADIKGIKKVIRGYYEQLYINNFDNCMKWMNSSKNQN